MIEAVGVVLVLAGIVSLVVMERRSRKCECGTARLRHDGNLWRCTKCGRQA